MTTKTNLKNIGGESMNHLNIDSTRPYGLRTFLVRYDGSLFTNTEHRGYTHEELRGEYCYADDALEYIQLLLAYRDGHKVGSQECYVDDSGDFRCEICQEVDRRCGDDKMIGKLDTMLSQLRSKNNGL